MSPPCGDLPQLDPPLKGAERRLVEMFHDQLAEEWEIYTRPHLNGLRPSVVVLHPDVGTGVFQVVQSESSNEDIFEKPLQRLHFIQRNILELYCPRLEAHSGIAAITLGLVLPHLSDLEVDDVESRSSGTWSGAHIICLASYACA